MFEPGLSKEDEHIINTLCDNVEPMTVTVIKNCVEKLLNEAYNIGIQEGYYKGLSEGRRTSDATND